MKDLKGKVAVVTGAASGLGRSMALAFASEGMDVALADVDQTNLSSVADEVQAKGVRAITLKVDVSQAEQVEAFRDHALARLGAIHVVCNNAGVSPLGAAWENTPADWQWILGVNLWGVINGVRAFTPYLIAQNEGHIVNTASVSGLISPPGSGAYNATKHAVVALTESINMEECAHGIRATSVLPGEVATPILEKRPVPPSQDERARMLQADDLGKTILFIASLPARACVNELIISPTWNRFYLGGLETPKA